MNQAPNHALQRTPGFGVQLPSAAVVRPAQSRAVRPATKPSTARAFALAPACSQPRPRPGVAELGVVRRLRAHHQKNTYMTSWKTKLFGDNRLNFYGWLLCGLIVICASL